jgi:hypothetical protein
MLPERATGPVSTFNYGWDTLRQNGYRKPVRKLAVPLSIMQQDIAYYVRQGASSIASYGCGCDGEYWDQFGEPPLAEYGAALQGEAQQPAIRRAGILTYGVASQDLQKGLRE